MIAVEHKQDFTKGELVAFKRLVRFSAKYVGVANAKIETLVKGINEKLNGFGVSLCNLIFCLPPDLLGGFSIKRNRRREFFIILTGLFRKESAYILISGILTEGEMFRVHHKFFYR